MSERMRSAGAVVALAARRALARPAPRVPAIAGVALAVALLAGLAGAATIAGDRLAAERLARLTAAQRTLRVIWNGGVSPTTSLHARAALSRSGAGAPTQVLLLQPARAGSATVRLGAVAPLAGVVQLDRGRLPRGPCRADRCEVVQVGGAPVRAADLAARGPGLVIVGSGRVTSSAPLGFVPPGPRRDMPEQARPPAVLLSGDPAGVDRLPSYGSIYRTGAFVGAVPVAGLHSWDLEARERRLAAAQRSLANEPALTVEAPQAAFAEARAAAHRPARRILLVGGLGVIVLGAFLVLAAGVLRPDLLAETARLRRAGATRGQRLLLGISEGAVPVTAGIAAGAAIGAAIVLVLARRAGLPLGGVLAHGVLTAAGLGALAGLAAGSLALLVLAAYAPARAAVGVSNAALVAAAAALIVLLLTGAASGSGSGAAVVALLVIAVSALAIGRAGPPVLGRVVRAAPPRRPRARMALAGMARAPSAAVVTAAALAAAVGVGGFASAYRATLRHGQEAQAAHRVPLDARITAGPGRPGPRPDEPRVRRAVQEAGAVVPVVRRDGDEVIGSFRTPVTLVGVPAARLPGLSAWRTRDAAPGRSALASRIRPPGDPDARRPAVPPDARTVSIDLAASGETLTVTLLLAGRGGILRAVPLGTTGSRRRLRATLSPGGSGQRVAGVSLARLPGALATAGHQGAESGVSPPVAVTRLRLGPLRFSAATRVTLVPVAGWTGSGPARDGPGGTVVVRFDSQAPALLRPPAPGDRVPVPVLADPLTARDAGGGRRLQLDAGGGAVIPAQVVGVLRHFPTVGRETRVVLADSATLRLALDARVPGAGTPTELWVAAGPDGPRGLARSLASLTGAGLVVETRSAALHALRGDPLARALLGALTAVAALAALLALLGLGLMTGAMVRDDDGGLRDLEAQGIGPRELRRVVAWRALVIAGTGIAAGALLAVLVTPLVVGAVGWSAAAETAPEPPLVGRSRGSPRCWDSPWPRSSAWPSSVDSPRGPSVSPRRRPSPSAGNRHEHGRRLSRAVQGAPHDGG